MVVQMGQIGSFPIGPLYGGGVGEEPPPDCGGAVALQQASCAMFFVVWHMEFDKLIPAR